LLPTDIRHQSWPTVTECSRNFLENMDDSTKIPIDLTYLHGNSNFCSQGHALTPLDHLLTVHREVCDENELLSSKLEHSIKVAAEHQAALKSTSQNIDRLKNLKQKLEKKLNKFQHIEVIHSELKNGVKELEDKLTPLRNQMREDVERLKKINSDRTINDDQKFTKKLNELEDKFNEERDRLLGEINQRKEQLNVRQAKAEFQV